MARHYRRRPKFWLWCWRCGLEFEATRGDAVTCGPTCRSAVQRDYRADVFPAYIYPFRFGPKRGRLSRVFTPDNIAAIPPKWRRKWV